MTATTFTDATVRPTPRRLTGATGVSASLHRWTADRRRGRYLTEKRRHDARDRSDRYLDRTDDTHQRQTLVTFVQR